MRKRLKNLGSETSFSSVLRLAFFASSDGIHMCAIGLIITSYFVNVDHVFNELALNFVFTFGIR